MIPPMIAIDATDFHNAWARAVRYVLRNGTDITIGDVAKPKAIRDSCGTIVMTGNAIKQVEAHEIHPQYPFKHVAQYCETFTREYLEEYVKKTGDARFSYLYFERLASWVGDQIECLRFGLQAQVQSNIASNRNQAITWDFVIDGDSGSPPCLQRIWVRYLGNREVDVHLTWRSRDLFTAWQSNVIALVDMINREIVHPNGCKIVRIVDYSDSFHIYHPLDEAAGVKFVSVNPQVR